MSVGRSQKTLEQLRSELRQVDDDMIRAVISRMEIVGDIGRLKQAQGLNILDTGREDFNKERSRMISDGKLPAAMVEQLTDLLALWARDVQAKVK
jgi:chorismate mutase